MKNREQPTVWSVAGSDSCAGAGIQADLKTFSHLGVVGCTVITAITAQNTMNVSAISPCDHGIFRQQLDTLQADFPPHVIKSGMLASVAQVEQLAKFLNHYTDIIYICDPVMVATAGTTLANDDVVAAMKKWLLPRADLLTPNRHEAMILAQQPFDSMDDGTLVSKKIFAQYSPQALLLKGGDLAGAISQDSYYHHTGHSFSLQQPRQTQQPIHGTGCTLSAAIAAFIALGSSMEDAVVQGKCYINQAINHSQFSGNGSGLLNHHFATYIDTLPHYQYPPQQLLPPTKFMPLARPIDFYPLVDSSSWLPILAQANIKTAQLRIKDRWHQALATEIKTSIALAKKYDIDLFINDHWQLAIEYGAYGVHLGQEDIDDADLSAIHQAGLRLGLSSHDYYELARTIAIQPSYIALGPIYHTTSKAMNFVPQGVEKVTQWRQLIADNIPLIAIGGIQSTEQMATLIDAGADAIAVISCITGAQDPITNAKAALETIVTRKMVDADQTINSSSPIGAA